MSDVYVNAVGLSIELDTGQDLTGKTVSIRYLKPNGTEGTWAASVMSGQPTVVQYVTQTGDIDLSGRWVLQAQVQDTGLDILGKPANMQVAERFS